MNNTEKFTGKAENYSKFRPVYPNEYIDYLKSYANLCEKSIVADIGSGTGILTKQLSMECNTVYAVEPNLDMINKAKFDLKDFNNIIFFDTTAENTGIPENSVDLVTVGQAYHWFDKIKFFDECKRFLKSNGYVSLVWNNRDIKSDCINENFKILKKYCPDFKGFSSGTDFSLLDTELNDFFDSCFEIKEFKNTCKIEREGFIGRCLSSSYVPNDNKDLIYELNEIFDRFSKNNMLDYPYITRSYTGKLMKED
ncbi:MAG: class I SAM-dependent methyltransferase [Acutalibacteraceae bacterium]|nr:class I SAM-dependent methyltransferase [Acutalibacteraceae bacterium]